jgi:hypothetical protein
VLARVRVEERTRGYRSHCCSASACFDTKRLERLKVKSNVAVRREGERPARLVPERPRPELIREHIRSCRSNYNWTAEPSSTTGGRHPAVDASISTWMVSRHLQADALRSLSSIHQSMRVRRLPLRGVARAEGRRDRRAAAAGHAISNSAAQRSRNSAIIFVRSSSVATSMNSSALCARLPFGPSPSMVGATADV